MDGAEASDLKLAGVEMFLSNFPLQGPNIMAYFHIVLEILGNFVKKNIRFAVSELNFLAKSHRIDLLICQHKYFLRHYKFWRFCYICLFLNKIFEKLAIFDFASKFNGVTFFFLQKAAEWHHSYPILRSVFPFFLVCYPSKKFIVYIWTGYY